MDASWPALILPGLSHGHPRIKSEESSTPGLTPGLGRGGPVLCSL